MLRNIEKMETEGQAAISKNQRYGLLAQEVLDIMRKAEERGTNKDEALFYAVNIAFNVGVAAGCRTMKR